MILYRSLAPKFKENFGYMVVSDSAAYTSDDLQTWQTHSGQGGLHAVYGNGKWLIQSNYGQESSFYYSPPINPNTTQDEYRIFDGNTFIQNIFSAGSQKFWPACKVVFNPVANAFYVIGKFSPQYENVDLAPVVLRLFSSSDGVNWSVSYTDVKHSNQIGFNSGRIYFGAFAEYNIKDTGNGESTPPITSYVVRGQPNLEVWNNGMMGVNNNGANNRPFYTTIDGKNYTKMRPIQDSTLSGQYTSGPNGFVFKTKRNYYGSVGASTVYIANTAGKYIWGKSYISVLSAGGSSSYYSPGSKIVEQGSNILFTRDIVYNSGTSDTPYALACMSIAKFEAADGYVAPATTYQGEPVMFGQGVYAHNANGVTYIVGGGPSGGKIYQSLDDGLTVTDNGRNLLPGGAKFNYFAARKK